MRKFSYVPVTLAAFAALAAVSDAGAQSIDEALVSAYTQSTQLGAQREQQKATDELVPQALSNWRPTVSVNGAVSRTYNNDSPQIYNSLQGFNGSPYGTSKSVGVQVTQPLYRGGKTTAQTSQATNLVQAGKAQLGATEQSVLLSTIQSYLDVARDQVNVELTANNENVLKRQFEATQDRFRVGEITRTDVALSQSSYDQSRAQHITALGALANDRATFQRIVGQAPGKLEFPVFKYQLPGSLEDAVGEAESNNPAVIASEYTERAARDAIDVAEGNRLPQVNLIGALTRTYPAANGSLGLLANNIVNGQRVGSLDHLDVGSVQVQMNWQLYTGGLVSSQVRQSKHTANQNLIAIEDAKRVARQTAISAWNQLQTARANIEAFTSQVNAAQIGAEGTRQQALVGTSTILDSLTAEQTLLQAQFNLVGARREALLDSYILLAATGHLNARDLGLSVKYYDPQANQDRVGDKPFGTGID